MIEFWPEGDLVGGRGVSSESGSCDFCEENCRVNSRQEATYFESSEGILGCLCWEGKTKESVDMYIHTMCKYPITRTHETFYSFWCLQVSRPTGTSISFPNKHRKQETERFKKHKSLRYASLYSAF